MSMFVKYSGCWWRLGPTECFLVTIPHSCDHLCSNTRTCEDFHQKCMEERHMRARPWATEGGEGRVKVRCQRSFLHLHLTHFTTLLFRQYNHFNRCLPSSAPPPPPLPPASVSTVRKDDKICSSLSLGSSFKQIDRFPSKCLWVCKVLELSDTRWNWGIYP